MNIKGSIIINRPREIVTKLFIDPNFIQEYQDGFVKKEPIKGKIGETGSISKLYYKYGKKDMVLTETVISNNLPGYFVAHYHHKHMDNSMKCTFTEIDDTKTKYEYAYDYTRMSFIPKVMAKLFPSMYKKPAEKWLNQFKNFVENS